MTSNSFVSLPVSLSVVCTVLVWAGLLTYLLVYSMLSSMNENCMVIGWFKTALARIPGLFPLGPSVLQQG